MIGLSWRISRTILASDKSRRISTKCVSNQYRDISGMPAVVCRFNFPTGREKPATRYRLLRGDPTRRSRVSSQIYFCSYFNKNTLNSASRHYVTKKNQTTRFPSRYHRCCPRRRRVSVSPRVSVCAPASPTYSTRNTTCTYARTCAERTYVLTEVSSYTTMRCRQTTPSLDVIQNAQRN